MIKPRNNKNRVEVFDDKAGWEYQVFVDGEFLIGCEYENDAEATKQRIIAVLDKTVEMCCEICHEEFQRQMEEWDVEAPDRSEEGVIAAVRRIMKPR